MLLPGGGLVKQGIELIKLLAYETLLTSELMCSHHFPRNIKKKKKLGNYSLNRDERTKILFSLPSSM